MYEQQILTNHWILFVVNCLSTTNVSFTLTVSFLHFSFLLLIKVRVFVLEFLGLLQVSYYLPGNSPTNHRRALASPRWQLREKAIINVSQKLKYELFSKIFQQTTLRHVDTHIHTHTSVFVRKPLNHATLHFLIEAAKPRTRPPEPRGLQRRI